MKLKNLIFTFALAILSSQALAESAALLVFDKKETTKEGLARNFRDLTPLGLNAIASGQFSEEELQAVRKKYPKEKIIIVDLRRESHGFINGEAVSWNTAFNTANSDKTAQEIIASEKTQLAKTMHDREIIVNKVDKKNPENNWYNNVDPRIVSINNAFNEEVLAKKNGFSYKRFTIQDHHKPTEQELRDILTFIKKLDPKQKIYVHCAAGKGRTTTFLTLLDITKNGHNTKLQDILNRQFQLGGANLSDFSEEPQWRQPLSAERLKMLQDFYKAETGKKK